MSDRVDAQDFLRLFKSEAQWGVPIQSFIEAYCLIFTPDESPDDEDSMLVTERREDAKERFRIFEDYKKLINEILADTLMRQSQKVTFSKLLACLGDFISDDAFLGDPQVFESLKYLLAVEDFKVFTVFMEDMNILLNDQSEEIIAKQKAKAKAEAEAKQLLLKQRSKSTVQSTPRDEAITLAMEISLAEEETRKQRLKELDEAEDEALKLALEASLQLAKEESLKSEAEYEQSQIVAEEAVEEPVQQVEEVKEGPPLVSQRSQQQNSDFRINKKKKLHLNLPKHQQIPDLPKHAQVQEQTQLIRSETLEERRARLRANRDAIKQQMSKRDPEIKEETKDTRSKEEQERLQRCLRVLREAADEVFKAPSSLNVKDQTLNDTLNQSQLDEAELLSASTDAGKVSNRFRKARLLNKMLGQPYKEGEDTEASVLDTGILDGTLKMDETLNLQSFSLD